MSIESLNAQLTGTRQKVERNRRKIRRLNTAKSQVAQIKRNLESRLRQLNRKGSNKDTYGDWTGDKQKHFQNFIPDSVAPEYQMLIYAVDNRLDAICDEITALQNENLRLNGVIGDILASINWLKNQVETSTN